MRHPVLLSIVLGLGVLLSREATADPIDYRRGLITGTDIINRAGTASQGIPIGIPVWDWIAEKDYTSMVVLSERDEHESYVGLGPTRDYGFSSALATGTGELEVGVDNPLRQLSAQRAASRLNVTIKNNTDQPFTAGMEFHIDRGFMGVLGIRSDHTAHLRLEALIDYLLLTPAGPFGGHYDETTGNLFSYYADLGFDNRLTHSDNANVTLIERHDFALEYVVDPFDGYVSFPEIPAHGELTVYYDMYAHMNIQRFEIGGYARLGDPLDLTVGPGIRIVPARAQVPEPGALALVGGGLLAGALRRTWRARCSG